MDFDKVLDTYLRARFTLIILVTNEEERVLQSIRRICEQTQRGLLTWDSADYFQTLSGPNAAVPNARDPLTALEQIEKYDPNSNTVFVLKDFHDFWSNVQVKRKLRGLAQRLKFTKKYVLITTHIAKVPDELKDEAVMINFPLPDAEATYRMCLTDLVQTPGVSVNLTPLGREKLVQAALGLTCLTGPTGVCQGDRHRRHAG